MKGLIVIQNKDNESFKWCLVRYLNPLHRNSVKIRQSDSTFAKQLDFKDIKFL